MIGRNPGRWAALALCAVLVGGCATRGYVRDRIAESDAQLTAADGKISGDLDRVRETASSARERGDVAARDARQAHDLALGDVDWKESGRYTVNFAFDSAALTDDATRVLDEAARAIDASRRAQVDLYGYTDTTGDAVYNEYLSARRADAVLRYLLNATQAPLTRFSVVGLGESAPVEQNGAEDRDASRRVIVSLLEASPPSGGQTTQLSKADVDQGSRR